MRFKQYIPGRTKFILIGFVTTFLSGCFSLVEHGDMADERYPFSFLSWGSDVGDRGHYVKVLRIDGKSVKNVNTVKINAGNHIIDYECYNGKTMMGLGSIVGNGEKLNEGRRSYGFAHRAMYYLNGFPGCKDIRMQSCIGYAYLERNKGKRRVVCSRTEIRKLQSGSRMLEPLFKFN